MGQILHSEDWTTFGRLAYSDTIELFFQSVTESWEEVCQMELMMIVYTVLGDLFQLYSYMMIAWILMSWVPNLKYSKFGIILGKLVEPYLSIFRRVIPSMGGIDFSPIIAFFVYRILVGIIFNQILPLLFHI